MLALEPRRKLPTLLLIDDDLVSREVTATMLTMSGYTVFAAADGAASLELLADGECAPDAILMDAQMPGLSGAPLIAKLRACAHVPVYVISASNPGLDLALAADGVLLKPFDHASLGKLLQDRSVSRAPVELGPNQPVLHAATLAQFRIVMSETAVRQVYAAVVADLDQRVKALEAAIASADQGEIRRIGHAIKGGCGMVGARQAARLGERFEEIARDPKIHLFENGMAMLDELRVAARNLERMLIEETLA